MVKESRGPLADLLVVVFGNHVAKAQVSKIFSALGANVIEIASIMTEGDAARYVPPLSGDKDSFFFWVQNHGRRRNIGLDLRQKEAREIADRLLERADVFIGNQTIDVLEKSGMSWEALHAKLPRLICGYISYAGHTGPESKRPGYHHIAEAESGATLLNSESGPTLAGLPYIDHATADRLVTLILAALYERTKTGVGVKVEVGLKERVVEMLGYHAGIAWNPRLAKLVHIAAKAYQRHQTVPTLFNAVCAGGTRLVVAAVTNPMVKKLLEALNVGDLMKEERFASAAGRLDNANDLLWLLHDQTRRMSVEELENRLNEAGVPCAQHRDITDVVNDEQLRHRGMIVETEGPDGQPLKVVGFAGKYGDHEPDYSRARRYGEDTFEVLRELGFSEEQLAEWSRPRNPEKPKETIVYQAEPK